ncbi:MAG: ACT domain-containing protein [Eubacteriales bacterium]
MKIRRITHDFSICKIYDTSVIDLSDEFCFFSKTDEEMSLVCTTDHVPDDTIDCDHGWRAFRIDETLDFSLIGILSRISSILADRGIGMFAISTFNTDYILTRKNDFENALSALASEGYEIVG